MTAFDRALLAEKTAAVERHLLRVAARLPPRPEELAPSTDASDAVVLHLWQATQVVIDLALSCCLRFHLGTPSGYSDAFERLAAAGILERALANRLKRAAGFRNVVAHAYESIDLRRVFDAAQKGPDDLRAFLKALRDVR